MKLLTRIFAATLVIITSWCPVTLASSVQETPGWHFLVAPYMWGSAVQGDLTLRGRNENFYVSFTEILKRLNFAAQGHLEANKGNWTLMLDPTYLKVSDKRQRDAGLVISSKTALIDAGIFYRIFAEPVGKHQYLTLELLGGARYLGLTNALNFRIGPTLSDSTHVTGPIVGARIKADISPKTMLWLRGDVGGFHVDNMDQTWSATLGFSYAATRCIDLGIAYRVLKLAYTKEHSAMSILMYGPMAGVGFRF